MDVDPRRLAVLLAIQRAGGVLAAADTLRISPSAVSQQIARLEAETGVRVLDRRPTGAVLTAAGHVLAEAGERIESELTDVRRTLAALEGDVAGTVVVGAFQTVIRAVLVPMLLDLPRTLPGVELVVRETSPEGGQRALRTAAVDLLVLEADAQGEAPTPRGVRDVPFLDEPWIAVLPAGLTPPSTLVDLAGHTWLGVEPGTAAARAVERVARTLGTVPETAHRYADFDVAIALVAAGLGIALLPSLALQRVLPDGVQAVAVPGLGSRRLVVRHRVTRKEPRPEVLAVLEQIVEVAGALELA
ncbi:LysR family transcriptional regulator [Georgenia faecalis]|uniref:LysR family transcriptional regulator n=1 Tax=Georgenia faecalis TaxID=2483799 RepID=A0ABV9D6W7_9MICO|nr:LysR family transcriptional regulator [Georgenia faecalis]